MTQIRGMNDELGWGLEGKQTLRPGGCGLEAMAKVQSLRPGGWDPKAKDGSLRPRGRGKDAETHMLRLGGFSSEAWPRG